MRQEFIGLARRFLDNHEAIAPHARRLKFLLWKLFVRLRCMATMGKLIDPHRTLWVNTGEIVFTLRYGRKGYEKYWDRGKILDGNWDKEIRKFDELDVYQSFEDHFLRGVPWEGTRYYQRLWQYVLNGKIKRYMRDKEDVDKRMQYLEDLYERIKKNGFKPTVELGVTDWGDPSARDEDEISVRIGRYGDFLFEDGRHRLAIAKVLGVGKVPVKVTVRHKKWFEFTKEIWAYAKENRGKVDNTLSHPDLSNIPYRHGWEQFEIIKKNLPFSSGDVLDIGCHWGSFCIQLEKMGFNCVGVESDPRNLYFLRKLRRAEKCRFEIIDKSIFDYTERSRFDLVLALYVFDRFLKTEKLHENLIKLLGRLKTRAMILGCHNQDQGAMQSVYRNYSPEEFVSFIIQHSNLSKAKHIVTGTGGRELYLVEA